MVIPKRFLLVILVSYLTAAPAAAQEDVLGTIDFPNAGSEAAQNAFLNGVRLLHSFEWDDAAEAFQEAQRIDPDFALAYWGEAMSHTTGHHFPPGQDMSAAREALGKLAKSRSERLAKATTEREKGYLEAVEILYGPGDRKERAVAYSEAMGQLSAKYPDDLEAAAFYSLSLMRTQVRGEESLREDVMAGAIAQGIFRQNPDHPGAAHYIIHAFDSPIHAPIALYAADKYAQIAAAAVHALHMPTHIFVQHGMWNRVAASNRESYDASVARAKRKGLSPTRYSFHALYWLQYAHLQQGRYDEAEQSVEEIRGIAALEEATRGAKERFRRMEALQTVETERWKVADVSQILKQIEGDASFDSRTVGVVLFANGVSAARTGELDSAKRSRDGLAKLKEKTTADETNGVEQVEIMMLELEALIALAEDRNDDALVSLKKATVVAESMEPPSGPPGESPLDSPVKPAHELYAETLLELSRPDEALEQFQISLLRMPMRARSLVGAARAASAAGQKDLARRYYGDLLAIPDYGSDLPGREEAEQFVGPTEN